MHARLVYIYTWGGKSVLFREVSLFQECPITHTQGIISSERVGGVMRSAFPGKTPAMLAQLVSSAKSCREGGGVNFIKMLSPVSRGEGVRV